MRVRDENRILDLNSRDLDEAEAALIPPEPAKTHPVSSSRRVYRSACAVLASARDGGKIGA
jgi:hypothetical protein